jgi:hypothetical protein
MIGPFALATWIVVPCAIWIERTRERRFPGGVREAAR